MKLRMMLAVIAAVMLARMSFAGDCGCTGPIGPPSVSCTSACGPNCGGCNACCRLFPSPCQLFRGIGKAFDCLLPCHGCGVWDGYCGGGCGTCCGPRHFGCGLFGTRYNGCGRAPCASCLWPPLHCCPYDQSCRSCGGLSAGYGGYEEVPYDAQGPVYSNPQQVPTPAPQMDDAPGMRADPFQDDPAQMMQMQTRATPRRSNSVSLNAPYNATQKPVVASRPIKQTSANMPALAQPRVNAPAATPLKKPSTTSTRINSKITPASHEADVTEEPATMELPPVVSPLRVKTSVSDSASGLPVNPLR